MTYYCKHNICPMETNIPEATDTVQVSRNLHFEQIADLCGISLEEIKEPESPIQEKYHPRREQAAVRYASPSTTSVPSLTARHHLCPPQ